MNEEVNLIDYVRVLLRWKKLIVIFVGCATVFSIIYAIMLPNRFMATATILPVGGSQAGGIGALLSQSGLGSLLGGMSASSSESGIQLMAILKSKTLAEQIINKLGLKKIFYAESWDKEKDTWKGSKEDIPSMEDTVDQLHDAVKFNEDKKTKLIVLEGVSTDPKLSAIIVNAYINELVNYLIGAELTSAKKNRVFIESQLSKTKAQLLETGKRLSKFYADNKISSRDPRIDVKVSIDSTVDSLDNQEAIDSLESKKDKLEKKMANVHLVKDVPQQVYLEYLTGYYQLLGQINALLTQQYEMAKINESKEDISFQVIDWARVPEKRHSPKRRYIVIIAFMVALFMVVFLVFFLEYVKKVWKAEQSQS